MMKFKYIGIGIALGLVLSLYILSENKAFNFLAKSSFVRRLKNVDT